MKSISFTYLLIIIAFSTMFGQQIKFYGYDGNNSSVPADSVVFGFTSGASMGIDEQLGEQDITDVPIQIYDLRIIQRTADDFYCLYDEESDEITYDVGFDSKVNFRGFTGNGIGRYFEVINMSENFDGGYFIELGDYIDSQNDINDYYLGFFAAYNCPPNLVSYNDLLDGIPGQLNGIIVTPRDWATDSLYKSFYFYIEPDSSLTSSTLSVKDSDIAVFYPNPAEAIVHIESKSFFNFELYDAIGRRVLLSNTDTKLLNVQNLPSGVYYLSFFNNHYRKTEKLIITN